MILRIMVAHGIQKSKENATVMLGLMPEEKAPSSGAFLPASLMYFCSGEPMHFCCGVDTSIGHLRSDQCKDAFYALGQSLGGGGA